MTHTFGPPTLPVRALETELSRIRDARNTLLDIELQDRYGSHDPESEAQWSRDATEARRSRTDATAKLEALVARLRTEDPAAIATWVERHIALLDDVIEANASAEDGSREAVTVSVAKDERAAWAEVLAGGRAIVDENGFYVPRDRERLRAWFGVDS